jgi:mono/diheme cytochrome c family protein
MSATAPTPELDADVADSREIAFEPRLVGVVAEFDRPEPLLSASASVRDAGFTRWDTYTPFPVHGIDAAMGLRPTVLPWIVLGGGLTGFVIAIAMQYWMNASREAEFVVGWPWAGYQYPISGKPYWSLPANMPVAFELTVLLASFGAFFGMIALNRLLQFYNPMFKLERFRRVTTDRFFLAIDASDPKFDASGGTAELLRGLGATAVDECWDDEPRRIPGAFATVGLVLFAFALIPPALVMRHRSVSWDTPEYHIIWDMDFQAKYKSQQRNPFFADQRADRPQVVGTIARGQLEGDDRYYLGVEPGQAMASFQEPAGGAANNEQPAPPPGDGQPGNGQPGDGQDNGPPAAPGVGMDENQNWGETIPIEVTDQLMRRGQERYDIYCAPCHGVGGYGDGLINQRALSLNQPTWVPVPSLHTPQTRNRPDGYIYRAITDGVRKMPAYGSQIAPHDRWAIVLYVRALQRSQGANGGAAPDNAAGAEPPAEN